MTQPYGQQPGNFGQQPGGYPQQGGYPQSPPGGFPQSPPAGYPQQGGYPQAPSYAPGSGGLPQAPPDQGHGGPVTRPGSATAAAVLGFVQGGITTITTLLIIAGLVSADAQASVGGWLLAIAQTAGIVLLIWGGVKLMTGGGRGIFLAGAVLELLICGYYIIRFVTVDTGGFKLAEDFKSAGVLIALIFAVMPAIGLILSMGGATTQFLTSRRAGGY
jgi:hypothetical protein